MNLLLIEDNRMISKGIAFSLQAEGFSVTVCETCADALSRAGEEWALVVIDVMLPDGDGFELYEELRRVNTAPVIFLTARDDEDSIVRGLDLGADDYITKPFSIREFLARVRRLTRKAEGDRAQLGSGIEIDFNAMSVTKSGAVVELTALEYRIFSMLARNAGTTVTREKILEKIWDVAGNYVNDNTLSVYIRRIRAKLDCDLIKTVKGTGYRLEKL